MTPKLVWCLSDWGGTLWREASITWVMWFGQEFGGQMKLGAQADLEKFSINFVDLTFVIKL